jgi:hypothetical protein
MKKVSLILRIVKSNIESEIKESPIISELEYETPQENNTVQRKKLMKESEKIAQRRAEMIDIRDMQGTKLVTT